MRLFLPGGAGVTAALCCFPQVRPFTLGQLKELLSRTGTIVEEGFWIDKIKSHCFVTVSTMHTMRTHTHTHTHAQELCLFSLQYATTEEAVATRDALHRVKWPQSNPKVLSVDFCEQDEVTFFPMCRNFCCIWFFFPLFTSF